MGAKIKVGLIYGGESFEHEVSIMTAQSIRENIDREKFDVTDIYIDKNGKFDENLLNDIDVAFLAVHGPNCEDGKLQQYLEDQSIKYTGPGMEASALNMDKIRMHDAFKNADLPVVEYMGFDINNIDDVKEYVNQIGLPVFVKPNNGGSSVGMTKVESINDLDSAIDEAFEYDQKIIIEKGVATPREIEVAILGNDDLTISEPGKILSNGEFYSFDSKYKKPFETSLKVELSAKQINETKEMAEKAYRATGCRGYSRVDFLLNGDNIYLNEINTLPGFTSISMFPKLMANVGIGYKELITKIIELALK